MPATETTETPRPSSANWQDGAACPYCGSDEIEGANFDAQGLEAWQEVSCRACERYWFEVYEMSFAVDRLTGETIAHATRRDEDGAAVHRWRCAEHPGEMADMTAWDYANIGTPQCPICDADMEPAEGGAP